MSTPTEYPVLGSDIIFLYHDAAYDGTVAKHSPDIGAFLIKLRGVLPNTETEVWVELSAAGKSWCFPVLPHKRWRTGLLNNTKTL